MNEKINDGGPAFPCPETDNYKPQWGMSLRAYAAIKLKQPDSGIDWLDEMILKSKRDEVAAKAMQGLLSNFDSSKDIILNGKTVSVAQLSYMYSDSMLKAREE